MKIGKRKEKKMENEMTDNQFKYFMNNLIDRIIEIIKSCENRDEIVKKIEQMRIK